MLKVKLLALFATFFFTYNCFSQEEHSYVIQGKIVSEKGYEINDAYLIDLDKGTLLDVSFQGEVTFKASLPLNISISHISYENKIVSINPSKSKLNSDTLLFTVNLNAAVNKLDEIEIRATKSDLAYKKASANVNDYVFYENSILLLLGIGRKQVLRLIDDASNTLYEQTVVGKNMRLVMDCFKNIHLVKKENTHQIKFTDSSFTILPPYSLTEYEKTLKLCKASLNQNLIIAHQGENAQEIHYYIKGKNSDSYRVLKKIRDFETQMGFKFYASNQANLKANGINSGSVNTRAALTSIRALDRSFTFFKHVNSKPLYCPIFKVRNNFLLFDHFNNYIIYYDEKGKGLDSTMITYHFTKQWNQELIQDYFTDDIYAVFDKGTNLEVRKLDLATGNLSNSSVKSKKRFPTKLKIRDHKLYYLQRDNYKAGLPQQLFVLDIK